jgi:hypothetical protein
MVDILFLAHKRPEFTRESLKALLEDTWGGNHEARRTSHIFVMTDRDIETQYSVPPLNGVDCQRYGGPVACLNAFLKSSSEDADGRKRPPEATHEFIAKIDNDTIVPPGWLPAALDIMRRYPNVDLLGIEPWTPDRKLFPRWVEPLSPEPENHWKFQPWPTSHIGGIGLFRRSAFERFGRPVPNSNDGRFGFTEWQWQHPRMVKAFIQPPLPVFLLDHLPFEPWVSLSRKYESEGVQRNVGWMYDARYHSKLWEWSGIASGEAVTRRASDVGGPR